MPTIKYIEANGTEHEVEVAVGENLMQAALDNMINGILGDCGGACACATCHCYVDDAWTGKIPAADDVEKDLLDMAVDPQENSRLACQIIVSEDMDGLTLRLPESQF
ncbi:2Fe-2S iron-sulfur cluster-binding protein [Pseudomaricurvus sp. HS19]|uniref:2Fe-2S iron-sulfur cluster-binding protein n=1 Tax=Pseudomaricurvus sp. HS19 TaxID=2692626 RepID=UPI00136A63D3|nr:2Fe-2S iron-sulfur cluster-binding protein [Pseudomaricurvus sp. HS19]MYM62145.1 2Fe-2S iron-sulfur cluster binding domain-containing protein [Pseudomaricurvus sp. HS19]